ncbi:hypothetical protein EYC80_007426 [Monilinia laxa]|uniref:Ankyrin repeat protein n=1 Tax=Monilinia laxa TaxID=61186 RepID=A0A5N6JVG1_MONLA|nr:hypothetical protein EYC80_007426 [Monilinia laxa]
MSPHSETGYFLKSPYDLPIFLACRLGIYTALGDWWDDLDGCLEEVDRVGRGLVELATRAKYYPLCKRLLDAGASVDKGNPGTSISSAIDSRNLELVQLVYEKNQLHWDYLIQHDTFKRALYLTFSSGSYEIGRYMISDRRLNVNMHVPDYRNLIGASVESNDPKMLDFLINRSANVEAYVDGEFGIVLEKAAHEGNLSIVKCLISRGTEINLLLKHGSYGSALAAAVANDAKDNLDIVKYLIERSANINLPLKCGKYGGALADATSLAATSSAYYSEDTLNVVKYLIERGAEINLLLKCGYYGNTLAAAATADNQTNSSNVIKYLIEFGANINIMLECGYFGNALTAAASVYCIDYNTENRCNIVKYLIEHGADMNLPVNCGNYGSALAAAVFSPKELDIVRYLVECGAETNLLLEYGEFGSALTAGAYYSHLECVNFLISKGALVNLKVNRKRFPML